MPHSRLGPRQEVAALFLTAASLAALIFPVLGGDGLPAGHDSPAHLTYTFLFDRALRDGQFPVRWIEWVRAGYGQPLFNFYQPGLFYIIQAIHLAVPALTVSVKLTILLLWWTGTGFVYLTFRSLGRLPAAAGALTFAFSPYLLLDLFVRCAYPEFAGITFATGVLWALHGWLTTVRAIWLPTVATLAALLIVSHPPTALIMGPVFVAYTVYLLLTRRTSMQSVAALLPAGLLAGGMSAFFLVPAMAESHFIQIEALKSDGFDFHRHFVAARQWLPVGWGFGPSAEGLSDGMSFQIGVTQWLALALAAAVSAVNLWRRTAPRRTLELAFWLAVAIGTMFGMTAASVRLWELFPPLAFVQFPWRLLMVVVIATAALSAHLAATITDRRIQAALVIGLAIVQIQLSYAHLRPRGYITSETMNIDWRGWGESRAAQESAFIEPGYYPASLVDVPQGIARWTVLEGAASVTEVSRTGHDLELDVVAEAPVGLRINSPAFPGWLVTIDGHPPDPEEPEVADGYLFLTVPAGRHRVRAVFTNTPVRAWANAVTLVSGVLTLIAFGWCGLRPEVSRAPSRSIIRVTSGTRQDRLSQQPSASGQTARRSD